MPYTHGVSKEDIFEAATYIFAQGIYPTQAKVRSHLGKGSFSTINKYLAQWREEQTDVEAVVERVEIPDEVSNLFKRLYRAAIFQAGEEVKHDWVKVLETENALLKERLENYEKTQSELIGTKFAVLELTNKVSDLARENQQIRQEKENLALQIEQLTQENEMLYRYSSPPIDKQE